MFLLMQDRADGHWPTDDNPSGDVWMYYMGKGMWCGDKPSAYIFATAKDAQYTADLLKKEADWAIKHMTTHIPCTGPFKIIPYE